MGKLTNNQIEEKILKKETKQLTEEDVNEFKKKGYLKPTYTVDWESEEVHYLNLHQHEYFYKKCKDSTEAKPENRRKRRGKEETKQQNEKDFEEFVNVITENFKNTGIAPGNMRKNVFCVILLSRDENFKEAKDEALIVQLRNCFRNQFLKKLYCDIDLEKSIMISIMCNVKVQQFKSKFPKNTRLDSVGRIEYVSFGRIKFDRKKGERSYLGLTANDEVSKKCVAKTIYGMMRTRCNCKNLKEVWRLYDKTDFFETIYHGSLTLCAEKMLMVLFENSPQDKEEEYIDCNGLLVHVTYICRKYDIVLAPKLEAATEKEIEATELASKSVSCIKFIEPIRELLKEETTLLDANEIRKII